MRVHLKHTHVISKILLIRDDQDVGTNILIILLIIIYINTHIYLCRRQVQCIYLLQLWTSSYYFIKINVDLSL